MVLAAIRYQPGPLEVTMERYTTRHVVTESVLREALPNIGGPNDAAEVLAHLYSDYPNQEALHVLV